MRKLGFAFLVIGTQLLPEQALACPACLAEASPEQQKVYLSTTVLLSALPLLLLGFIALRLYVASRHRKSHAE